MAHRKRCDWLMSITLRFLRRGTNSLKGEQRKGKRGLNNGMFCISQVTDLMDVPLWVKVNQRFLSCRTYTICSACQKHSRLLSVSCWSVEWESSEQAAPLGCSSPALLRPPRGFLPLLMAQSYWAVLTGANLNTEIPSSTSFLSFLQSVCQKGTHSAALWTFQMTYA